MIRKGLVFVLGLCLCLPAALAKSVSPEVGQHAEVFQKHGIKLDYLLYLPHDYGKSDNKKWPLIVFLHGSGERGDDVNRVKLHGPPKLLERPDNPLGDRFIVVSPQCPPKQWWKVEDLDALLDSVLAHYSVDTGRIYLTGLSMGGFGTWAWAERDPERFAAIAPMCGGGDPAKADRLKHTPVWDFHGEKDPVVPIKRSEDMIDAIKHAGDTDVKFTHYPDAGHDCWTRSYDNPELYAWFLKHKRSPDAAPGASDK